jgi:excisionase family DNA binding protein
MSARVAKTVTVQELAELLGISRNHAFRCVARGEIPSVRMGRRLLIPASFLEELFDANAASPLDTDKPRISPRVPARQ